MYFTVEIMTVFEYINERPEKDSRCNSLVIQNKMGKGFYYAVIELVEHNMTANVIWKNKNE